MPVLLGIAGAFVGTWIGHALGLTRPGDPAGFLLSVVGAMVLLLLYRLFARPRLDRPRDELWPQVVVRALAQNLGGLADEYERPGDAFDHPDDNLALVPPP